jgi:YHS domain-containing protein
MHMENRVHSQPEVAGTINERFVPVKLNADEFPTTAKMYGVTGLPTEVIITPSGTVVDRMNGVQLAQLTRDENRQAYRSGAGYLDHVTQVASSRETNPAHVLVQRPDQAGGQSQHADMAGAPGYLPSNTGQASPPAGANEFQTPNSYAGSGAATQPGPQTNPYPSGNHQIAREAWGNSPSSVVGDRYANGAMAAQQSPPQVIDNPYMQSPEAVLGNNTAGPAHYTPQPPQGNAPQADPRYGAQPPAHSTPPAGQSSERYQDHGQPFPAQQAQQPLGTSSEPQWGSTPQQSYGSAPGQVPQQSIAQNNSQPPAAAPAGQPPTGLEGFCPVTLKKEFRWQPGNRQWGAVHRGRTYLFAGPQQQQMFLQNPDYYSPVLSGIDPVLALDQQQVVEGRRKHGVFYEDQMYLFSNESTLARFSKNSARYAAGVRQAMQQSAGGIQRR